jgi:hypothetical protein
VSWTMTCGKCNRQFRVKAVEGGYAKCFKCGNSIDVPIRNQLKDYVTRRKTWQRITGCPRCNTSYLVNEDFLGKEALCKKCNYHFIIQDQTEERENTVTEAVPFMKFFGKILEIWFTLRKSKL